MAFQKAAGALLALSLLSFALSAIHRPAASYVAVVVAFTLAYGPEIRRLWGGRQESLVNTLTDLFGGICILFVAAMHLQWLRFR